jgi:hypothetical protein
MLTMNSRAFVAVMWVCFAFAMISCAFAAWFAPKHDAADDGAEVLLIKLVENE